MKLDSKENGVKLLDVLGGMMLMELGDGSMFGMDDLFDGICGNLESKGIDLKVWEIDWKVMIEVVKEVIKELKEELKD